jgi:hypothetical protein
MSIKPVWQRLLCMKGTKPVNNEDEIKLPFSLSKKATDEKKIKDHWRRIKEKIDAVKSENKDDSAESKTI